MRVRIRGLVTILTIAFGSGFYSFAIGQGFKGIVKNEQGIIVISTTGFSNPESMAAAWNLPVQQLLDFNPTLQTGSFSGPADIMIPVGSILKAATCEGCSPVYHRVQQSEGLFRIGRWYGNIPVSELKVRNNLRTDQLKPGQQLLIGYIKVPERSIAETGVQGIDSSGHGSAGTQDLPSTPTEETKVPVIPPPPPRELLYYGKGIFEEEFQSPAVTKKSGKSASFKSESGWKDGRFYILCNQLKSGVVVRIYHHQSGKTIFAKVVGPLSQIKQNEGLEWRINTAAAATLGIWDENEVFQLEIEY